MSTSKLISRSLFVLIVVAVFSTFGTNVAFAQYERLPNLRVTLAPKPAGQEQGFVQDPDYVYPMNPGQTYLPIAGHVLPLSVSRVIVAIEGTSVARTVGVTLFGSFWSNIPLVDLPPGIYHVTVNGFRVATIEIVAA